MARVGACELLDADTRRPHRKSMAVRAKTRLPYAWGATADEADAIYPCDARLGDADEALLRAVDVEAPAGTVFKWLCQLRVAPYSYDWIDNRGRRSPQQLTPGLEHLEPGQTVMTIFELKGFEPGRSLTVVNKKRRGARAVFGEIWCSYVIFPVSGHACRLVVKLLVTYPPGPVGWVMRAVLPLGDLVMM